MGVEVLSAYWSRAELATNGILFLHLLGAAAVGLLVGYERSYHGRAAGMRTYALVCVGSTILTAISGFPADWFGGLQTTPGTADPTRVVQGIVTGIGFLGAGVIMKEGFTIRGLSTAASIWVTAAIGVVIGIGFYGAAIFATLLIMAIMGGFRRLENALPHQTLLHLSLVYRREKAPPAAEVRGRMRAYGYEVVDWTYSLRDVGEHFAYDVVLQAIRAERVDDLVDSLSQTADLVEFRLSPSRN